MGVQKGDGARCGHIYGGVVLYVGLACGAHGGALVGWLGRWRGCEGSSRWLSQEGWLLQGHLRVARF
jgi:hypothetical protein